MANPNYAKDISALYYTIAFYNLENLFDTIDDAYTDDASFLPDSEKRWTPKRYMKKVRKLGYAISHIGIKTSNLHPVIVGLAEVENKLVIEDLLKSKFLIDKHYGIVHYDSPDERGIDVAMIYNKDLFKVVRSEVFSLELVDEFGAPDHTRDILMVQGEIDGEVIYILVNHWPSRRKGVEETEPSRIIASKKAIEIIHELKKENTNAKVIVMGDFNDGPNDKSIKELVYEHDLYNPMKSLLSYSRGSLNHQLQWNLFDQILFSTNFFETVNGEHSFSKANIFDQEFLKQFKGKYKGTPFRTYIGNRYKGGYSDHFPVYIHLRKNESQ